MITSSCRSRSNAPPTSRAQSCAGAILRCPWQYPAGCAHRGGRSGRAAGLGCREARHLRVPGAAAGGHPRPPRGRSPVFIGSVPAPRRPRIDPRLLASPGAAPRLGALLAARAATRNGGPWHMRPLQPCRSAFVRPHQVHRRSRRSTRRSVNPALPQIDPSPTNSSSDAIPMDGVATERERREVRKRQRALGVREARWRLPDLRVNERRNERVTALHRLGPSGRGPRCRCVDRPSTHVAVWTGRGPTALCRVRAGESAAGPDPAGRRPPPAQATGLRGPSASESDWRHARRPPKAPAPHALQSLR
jgi:hypothetical protein